MTGPKIRVHRGRGRMCCHVSFPDLSIYTGHTRPNFVAPRISKPMRHTSANSGSFLRGDPDVK